MVGFSFGDQMATPTYTLASQNWWTADGTTTIWPITFAGGYIDKSHVKAWKRENPGDTPTPIPVTEAMFVGDFQLNITPAVPNGWTVAIYRDTPKTVPLVDFQDGSNFSEVSLDTNARQAIFAAAETADLLTLSVFDSAGIEIEVVTSAAAAAASPLIDQLRNDFLSNLATKGSALVTYNPAVAASYPAGSIGAAVKAALDGGGGGGGGGVTLPPLVAGRVLGNDGTNLSWVVDQTGGGGGAAVTPGIGLNLLDYIPATEWAAIRAGTSSYDCTTAITNWINALSNGHNLTGIVPAGRYRHGTIHAYYSAALNPGFNIKRQGKLHIVGDGTIVEHYLLDEANTNVGSVFQCVSGSGWIFSPIAEDANPFRSRDLILENLAFIGGQSDYLVNVRGVPTTRVLNCEFLATSTATGGLALTTSYFGVVSGCRFRCAVPGNTSNAIYTSVNGADAPGAGLFKLNDINASGFQTGWFHASGPWTLVTVENSQISSLASGYNVFINGFIDHLVFKECQFEAPCRGWIKGYGANYVKTLIVEDCWGLDKGNIVDAAAIDLLTPDNVYIRGSFQDMRKALCNVDALSTEAGTYSTACVFRFFEGSGTMRTMFIGRPPTEDRSSTGGAANARLWNPAAAKPLVIKGTGPGGGSVNATNLSVGTINTSHIWVSNPASATEYHSLAGYAGVWALFTSGATDVLLDSGATANLGNGFRLLIINRGSGTISVRNSLGAGLIGTIPANSRATFVWAGDFGLWL